MQMPKVTLKLDRFRPRSIPRNKLPFPVSPRLHCAQLGDAPLFEGVEPFKPHRWLELGNYGPRIVIGCATDLQRLAEQVELGVVELTSVDHAMVVLTNYGAKPLSDTLRVTLWQTFGVPVYELYVGPDNTLIASECEAHEGWHVEPGVHLGMLDDELILESRGSFGLRTGLTGSFEDAPCPCGRLTARILDIEALSRTQRPRQMAVSA
jgi:hypothetical protein